MNAAQIAERRRIKGRCFYCGAKIGRQSMTCAPCRPLLQVDPHYGPSAWKKDEPNAA